MADPVRFCGFNKRLTAPPGKEKEVGTLHVFSNGRENISCWKLTPEERLRVLETGEIWLTVASGQTCYPAFVSGVPLMMAQDMDTGEETVYHSDGRHIVEDSRRFATLHHGDQQYGDEPYAYHLEGVVQVLRDFGADWPFLVAGYSHDLEEDCLQDLSVEERRQVVANRFGPMIESMIWACTGLMFIDGVKQERKARNLQQYAKIQAFPQAAPVKVADRTFNMEESARTANVRMCGIYVDEVLEFDVNVGVHAPPEMRLRVFRAAVACLVHLPEADPEVVKAIQARSAEIVALINLAQAA